MRYLKTFGNHNNYEDFTETEAFVKPNVSYCIQQNEVHYNPLILPLVIKYNVADASNPTQLYTYRTEGGITVNGVTMFDKVVIDGVEMSITDLDAASGKTQLSVGEHTAKYTLKDQTLIGLDGDTSDPSSVKIGAMFFTCETVTAVEIPNTVTTIGIGTFRSCRGITSVTIPNSVTSIGDSTFSDCSSLTSITIPNSVTSIGSAAFSDCSGLTSITIPNSVTSIGDSAFANCTGLTSVTIGNSVTSIGASAFYGCTTLANATIPDSVTSIGNDAFCHTNLDEPTQAKILEINEYGICEDIK